jgi:hypothetical protein
LSALASSTTDSFVFYVSNLPLITWIKLFRKLFVTFNVCFSVSRENMLKIFICTKRYILEVLAHFDNCMEVNRDFSILK